MQICISQLSCCCYLNICRALVAYRSLCKCPLSLVVSSRFDLTRCAKILFVFVTATFEFHEQTSALLVKVHKCILYKFLVFFSPSSGPDTIVMRPFSATVVFCFCCCMHKSIFFHCYSCFLHAYLTVVCTCAAHARLSTSIIHLTLR